MQANSDPQHVQADVPPHVIRQVLHLLRDRGHDPQRLCKGLGFTLENLRESDFRVSYRQTNLFVSRAMQLLNDPGMGIAVGARQTIVSFGLPGLGMLTCPTLGEAFKYLIGYQHQAGAFTANQVIVDGRQGIIEVGARFHDPDFEPFFIEEVLVSGVAMARSLVGSHFRPARIELRYARPAYGSAYSEFFRCPVVFGAEANRAICDINWFQCPLSTYDDFMQGSIQEQIDQMLKPGRPNHDLIESIVTLLRASVDEMPGLDEIACALNFSERTLRRRLAELGVSYQFLSDKVRYECSLELLKRTRMPLFEIALATGFSDARNFRRAFKRWAGVLPNQIRISQGYGGELN